jgi:pimeloyl-ACP methyl ester carboxylesterase
MEMTEPTKPRKTSFMKTSPALALAATLSLAGCAQYATVSQKKPQFRPVRAAVGALVSTERRIVNALRQENREPLVAMDEYLAAAEAAMQQLARDPADINARNDYNFAVARVLGTIKQAKLDPWTHPLRVPAQGGDYVLTRKPDPRKLWNPALYDFTPADQFDIHGTYVREHTRKEGLGAPIVAIGREMNLDAKTNFSLPRIYYGVTAIIRFDGRHAIFDFEDPLATETVHLGGRTFPLAADYTVPIAVMLASANPKKLELTRLLRPEKYAETARIVRLQPYDPNKTVVLVIHGLMDTAATWTPMLNDLRGDEEIRRNYQFWFYSYPSGYPYPYSASILRRDLDAIEKKYPLHKPMVVIGHSMGGCISRLLITDTGDKLWLKLFGKPPAQTQLSPRARELFTDALIFRHRNEIGRVIFISSPLRGSEMASGWAGRIGSMLVKAPANLLSAGADALKVETYQGDDLRLKRIPNSVDTLAPNNRFVKAINTIPITPGIPYHTICGDRGRGDAPKSSDGVVPYWSSHLDLAQSELVVPSAHPAHQNPQAIAEVKRILKLNLAGDEKVRRRAIPEPSSAREAVTPGN